MNLRNGGIIATTSNIRSNVCSTMTIKKMLNSKKKYSNLIINIKAHMRGYRNAWRILRRIGLLTSSIGKGSVRLLLALLIAASCNTFPLYLASRSTIQGPTNTDQRTTSANEGAGTSPDHQDLLSSHLSFFRAPF